MADQVTLRVAVADDAPFVAAIDALVYPRPWSARMRLQQLTRSDGVHFVALRDGRIVAHGGILFAPDAGHVTTIAVDPAVQRCGLGAALLERLIHEAAANGCPAVTLEVRDGNEQAIGLYRRFEMRFAGRRSGYYADTGDDALIFWTPDLSDDYLARMAAGFDRDRPDLARRSA